MFFLMLLTRESYSTHTDFKFLTFIYIIFDKVISNYEYFFKCRFDNTINVRL